MLPDGWEVDDPYFYPRPPRGGRLRHSSKLQQNKGYFYPRPPRGGRPPCKRSLSSHPWISIHALREEGDCIDRLMGHKSKDFYPRPPRGGRHLPSGWFPDLRYFYPRPPRGGRRGPLLKPSESRADFYPRPTRGGRRFVMSEGNCRVIFLSTPSARRATQTLAGKT